MIDLNPSEITEWEAHLSSGKSCYTSCWIGLPVCKADLTLWAWACPAFTAWQRMGARWTLQQIPCSQLCGLGKQHPCLGCRVLHPGLSIPNFPQHSIQVEKWSKLILILVYVLLGNEFWMGQEVGVQWWPLPVLSSHHINHSLISPLHLREGGLSLSHIFLFYFLPSFITFVKLRSLLNLFH